MGLQMIVCQTTERTKQDHEQADHAIGNCHPTYHYVVHARVAPLARPER